MHCQYALLRIAGFVLLPFLRFRRFVGGFASCRRLKSKWADQELQLNCQPFPVTLSSSLFGGTDKRFTTVLPLCPQQWRWTLSIHKLPTCSALTLSTSTPSHQDHDSTLVSPHGPIGPWSRPFEEPIKRKQKLLLGNLTCQSPSSCELITQWNSTQLDADACVVCYTERTQSPVQRIASNMPLYWRRA